MKVKLTEVSTAFDYIRNHERLARAYMEVDEEMRKLIERYQSVLTKSEICKMYGEFWGCAAIEQYRNRFFSRVLCNTYNVFDKSHSRYILVLNAIKQNNPEWITAFEHEHEQKLARCKVSVYSLEEALTLWKR